MSDDLTKEKHSKRRHKDEVICERQTKIAKSRGIDVSEPHRFAKHHAMDCGQSDCLMCGNPRRTMKERTVQERRFDQKEIIDYNSDMSDK
jgi:protein-tyrosine-phosphatase